MRINFNNNHLSSYLIRSLHFQITVIFSNTSISLFNIQISLSLINTPLFLSSSVLHYSQHTLFTTLSLLSFSLFFTPKKPHRTCFLSINCHPPFQTPPPKAQPKQKLEKLITMAVTEALPSKPETPIEKTETFAEKTEILSEKTPTFTGKMVVDEVSGWLQIFDDGSVDRTWTGHSAVLPLISEIPPSPPCTFEIFAGKYNARLYLPKKFPGGEITKVPLLLHFHGGGFCISQPDWYMYTQFYSRLCDAAGAAILSVRMRRAPEHRLPAAIEDCCEALRWLGRVADGFEAEPLLHRNVDFNRIFFIGEDVGERGGALGLEREWGALVRERVRDWVERE
ncbi:hypothetical protein AMTRI_Chr01g127220 [Amborella trichopoda]